MEAGDGLEALEKVRRDPPDLVLLDVMMPKVTGFDVCQQLKADAKTKMIPVVIITALADIDNKVKGLELGADDFLTKPFHRQELLVRVSNLVRLKRTNDELDEYRKGLENKVQERTEELARSLETINKAYEETLVALGTVLDSRDVETEAHSRRVNAYTIRLCQALGITEPQLSKMARGALLHDVGKIGIPDGIIWKPGPLGPEEWTLMRKHPQYGRDIVSRITFLQDAVPIVYGHHEKYDGSGYPQGLKGDEIPLGARVFAVADAFDAITTPRPYKAARPVSWAKKEILRLARTHFDPDLAKSFVNIV
jgi:putative nucleotidyltransferase with HDIG domain